MGEVLRRATREQHRKQNTDGDSNLHNSPDDWTAIHSGLLPYILEPHTARTLHTTE